MKAEMDWIDPQPKTVGTAAATVDNDADHAPHAYIYVPDLSSQTGWASHRVPERQEQSEGRRQIGFRR